MFLIICFTKHKFKLNYYYYCIIHEVAHEHRLTPADSHSRPQQSLSCTFDHRGRPMKLLQSPTESRFLCRDSSPHLPPVLKCHHSFRNCIFYLYFLFVSCVCERKLITPVPYDDRVTKFWLTQICNCRGHRWCSHTAEFAAVHVRRWAQQKPPIPPPTTQ